MKKILFCVAALTLMVTSCKKKTSDPSITVTVSYPTIIATGNPYYSINIGDPLPSISATAYDSFYNEVCTVVTDASTLDNTTPGLYAVSLSAKNKYGFISYSSVFVAVTNVSDLLNLSGAYQRLATPTRTAYVTKLARGIFMTSNVGGVDTVSQATSIVPAVFAVTSDTTIDFGSQLTSAGTLTASQESLTLTPGDTTLNYALSLSGFGTSLRTFVKQ